MRALSEIAAAPFARHVVAKYTSPGTYSISLPSGKYHVTVVAGGGGAATCGWKTDVQGATANGYWAYSTGGGGGVASGDIELLATAEATVVVGAGSDGSGMSAVYDERPTAAFASIGVAEGSSFSVGDEKMAMYGGNSDGNAIAGISNTGLMTARPGVGGGIEMITPGFGNVASASGATGEIPLQVVRSVTGPMQTVHGGAAGGGSAPSKLGDAGAGGDATYGFVDGVVTFNGGGGKNGAVLIERIG